MDGDDRGGDLGFKNRGVRDLPSEIPQSGPAKLDFTGGKIRDALGLSFRPLSRNPERKQPGSRVKPGMTI
jgi:hypothetical protein